MAQLGVVYRLRVRRRGDTDAPWRLLGDIDEAGTRLVDVLPQAFEATDARVGVDGLEEPQPSVTFERHLPAVGFYAGAVFNHHEFGSRGVLNRVEQGDSVPFTEVDNQEVEIGVVASARPQANAGFVAFHVANGRSIKTDLERELKRWIADAYDLYLDLTPVAPTEAVEAAIENGGLGPVSFRKLEQPADLFANEAEWWADGEELGLAEYRLRPARSRRFPGRKLLRFVQTIRNTLPEGEEPVGFPELASFDAHDYDQLAVELKIHGRTKTVYFDQEGASMSHAFSWELDITPNSSDQQLYEALAELLVDEGD